MSEQKHVRLHIKKDQEWLAAYRAASVSVKRDMLRAGVKVVYWYESPGTPTQGS